MVSKLKSALASVGIKAPWAVRSCSWGEAGQTATAAAAAAPTPSPLAPPLLAAACLPHPLLPAASIVPAVHGPGVQPRVPEPPAARDRVPPRRALVSACVCRQTPSALGSSLGLRSAARRSLALLPLAAGKSCKGARPVLAAACPAPCRCKPAARRLPSTAAGRTRSGRRCRRRSRTWCMTSSTTVRARCARCDHAAHAAHAAGDACSLTLCPSPRRPCSARRPARGAARRLHQAAAGAVRCEGER